ncbi:MAG: DUF2254 domain-containing protein, partial [Planctomycetales bacterium]|nr:DUF2254 domain-containing protein [Planctomycetales bacterium]
MNPRFIAIWDTFRNGFWFIPSICMASALFAAWLFPTIDRSINSPAWLHVSESTARSTLSAITSAMFTIAGIVFSATAVTLSITASQLGPRLLRNFLQRSYTQFTFGACLGMSLYCLALLRRVDLVDGEPII